MPFKVSAVCIYLCKYVCIIIYVSYLTHFGVRAKLIQLTHKAIMMKNGPLVMQRKGHGKLIKNSK